MREAGEGSVARGPKTFTLTREAAAAWDQLTRLEQIRVELAVARVVTVNALGAPAASFLTASEGIAIEGAVGEAGAGVVVRSLKRRPRTE